MPLKQTLKDHGIEPSALDDFVHEAACRIASQINNQGIDEQLEYLKIAGYSDNYIILNIVGALPG